MNEETKRERRPTWDFTLRVVKPDGSVVEYQAPEMDSVEGERQWRALEALFGL